MSLNTRIKRYWQKIMSLNDFYFPPGHFYNPISSRHEINSLEPDFFSVENKDIKGIEINNEEIGNRLISYEKYYKLFEQLFLNNKNRQFYIENGYYTYSDAIFLFSILNDVKPKRYIEIGSGYSSILTIETDLLCLGNKMEKILIEPYPSERLLNLLNGNETGVEIISQQVQNVPISIFETLDANDILFIDSSHVSKIGSDLWSHEIR